MNYLLSKNLLTKIIIIFFLRIFEKGYFRRNRTVASGAVGGVQCLACLHSRMQRSGLVVAKFKKITLLGVLHVGKQISVVAS